MQTLASPTLFLLFSDFELALHNAFVTVFKEGDRKDMIGCLFHNKQAVFKYMVEHCQFPKELATLLMDSEGAYNVLTIVHMSEMDKAIAYLVSKIDRTKYPFAQVDKFVQYFRRVWCGVYKAGGWNVYDLYLKHEAGTLTPDDILFRCNNALESFNRWFQLNFPTPRPTMDVFVSVVRRVLTQKYDDLQLIQAGKLPMPARQPPKFPPTPPDFVDFVMPPLGALGAPALGALGAPALGALGAPALGALGAPALGVPGASKKAKAMAAALAHAIFRPIRSVISAPAVAKQGAVPKKGKTAVGAKELAVSVRPVVTALPPVPAKKGIAKKVSASKKADPTTHPLTDAAVDFVVKNTNWAFCEECEKWRKLPPHVDMDALPKLWYCVNNSWSDVYNHCGAPEEE